MGTPSVWQTKSASGLGSVFTMTWFMTDGTVCIAASPMASRSVMTAAATISILGGGNISMLVVFEARTGGSV
jgi:hypothetical protein